MSVHVHVHIFVHPDHTLSTWSRHPQQRWPPQHILSSWRNIHSSVPSSAIPYAMEGGSAATSTENLAAMHTATSTTVGIDKQVQLCSHSCTEDQISSHQHRAGSTHDCRCNSSPRAGLFCIRRHGHGFAYLWQRQASSRGKEKLVLLPQYRSTLY